MNRKAITKISLIDQGRLKIFLKVHEAEEVALYNKVIAPLFGDRYCTAATNNTLYDLAETILDNFDEFKYSGLFKDEKIDKEERILKLMGYIDDMCCVSFYKFPEETK